MLGLVALANAGVLRHALVVGANYGGVGLDPLRYAESDAQRVGDLLAELGGFDPSLVTVLYTPTSGDLAAAFHRHAALASKEEDDLFLFYYSGHADARGLRVGPDIYRFEALRSDLRAMPSEVKIGLLDACRSGTITRLKGAQLSQPFLYQDRLAAEGEAWITAASADEDAQESDKLRGSFFTHYLVSGLRGAADNGDGEVTLDEAYRYAFDRVVEHTGGTEAGAQHPNFDYRLKGEGQLALTRTGQGRATATLPEDLAGMVTVIRLPDKTPVAEVPKVPGRAVTLALAPGNYRVRLQQGRDFRESEIMLTDGARMTLSRWGATNVEAGSPKGAVLALDPQDLARKTAEHGLTWLDRNINPYDLRHSPILAGGISAVAPGGGQFSNSPGGKGVMDVIAVGGLFTASALANNPGFFTGSITGPDPVMLTAAQLYGASIADASFFAREQEAWRPITGLAFSTHTGWDTGGTFATPYIAGVSVDWHLARYFSLGVDRLGWTRDATDASRWNLGSRVMIGVESKHVRPAAFFSFGGRTVQGGRVDGPSTLVAVVGGGGNGRWYVSPRYFIEHEVRVESEGGRIVVSAGGGLGLHLGGGVKEPGR